MSSFDIYDRNDFFENSTLFTKIVSEDTCRNCDKYTVTHCLQVEDVELYLCTVCALNAREKIVKGLINIVREK